MVVQVRHKREQPRPRPSARFTLLGDGLLERTRSTTFALLGTVAAVGLAMIAVVMQEDWPLVAGSPVPRAPVPHASVGGATAVGARAPARVADDGSSRRRGLAARRHGPPPSVSAPAIPAALVASPGVPVQSQGGGVDGGGSQGAPGPDGKAPSAAQPKQAPSSPAAQPSPAPTAPSSPAPAETPPPEATASEAPPAESYTPSWSNGDGHAYGREDGGNGHGHDAGGRAAD